jgi:hypothetical protein
VTFPQQELGASFNYKRKTSLSPSGCLYISRQESGVLCGSIIYAEGLNPVFIGLTISLLILIGISKISLYKERRKILLENNK